MKIRFIAAIVLAASLSFSIQASAAFIDGKLKWLEVTASEGRTYADVSSQFGVGGDFEGYRYATGSELNALVGGDYATNSPIASNPFQSTFSVALHDYFIDYLATGAELPSPSNPFYDSLTITYNPGFDDYSVRGRGTVYNDRILDYFSLGTLDELAEVNGNIWDREFYSGTTGLLFDEETLAMQSVTMGTSNAGGFSWTGFGYYGPSDPGGYGPGSYLVKAVPIPAAAFMFAPALLGFMGLRRKAKKSIA